MANCQMLEDCTVEVTKHISMCFVLYFPKYLLGQMNHWCDVVQPLIRSCIASYLFVLSCGYNDHKTGLNFLTDTNVLPSPKPSLYLESLSHGQNLFVSLDSSVNSTCITAMLNHIF